MEELLVTLPEYYHCAVKPRGFAEFCTMFEAEGKPLALWELKLFDTHTGDVLRRIWTRNIVTDNGAVAMLKNTYNNAGSAVSIFNQLALSQDSGSTTLTSALPANQTATTTLAVASIVGAIANGQTLTLGYGGSAPQNVTVNHSGGYTTGATSITVNSFTVNSTGFSIGAAVVPVPTTSDNPSSLTSAIYSGALASGAFAFSGTGAGNRQVVISFTFPTTDTAGTYTDLWTVNTNPVGAAGETANHLIVAQTVLNSTTSIAATMTEKM